MVSIDGPDTFFCDRCFMYHGHLSSNCDGDGAPEGGDGDE